MHNDLFVPDSSLISVSAMRARSTRWPSSDSCDFDLLILDRSRSLNIVVVVVYYHVTIVASGHMLMKC